MARKTQKQTLHAEVIEMLKATQSDRLSALVPEIIEGDFASLEYNVVTTRPRHQWPPPQELSVTYGETLGLIYQSQAAIGHAEFVHNFTKGVATVAIILGPEGQYVLTQALDKLLVPILIGDGELPPIAPWLRPDLLASARHILEFTDIGNLRDLMAWNYGVWFAAVIVIGPTPEEAGAEVLGWLREVTAHFGNLGIPPA
jgi:hypothetical protein